MPDLEDLRTKIKVDLTDLRDSQKAMAQYMKNVAEEITSKNRDIARNAKVLYDAEKKQYEALEKEARLLEKELKNVERQQKANIQASQQAEKAARSHEEAMKSSSGSFATFSKAIGTTITVWYTFRTAIFAVRSAMEAVMSTYQRGAESIEDFNTGVIAASSIIAPNIREGANISEKLGLALEFSAKMMRALDLEATRHIATGKEIRAVWETLAVGGIVASDKDVRNVALLADYITLLTAGQNKEVQLRQEIRGLMDGQVKTQNRLSYMIDQMTGGQLKNLVAQWRAAGTNVQGVNVFLEKAVGYLGTLDLLSGKILDLHTTWKNTVSTMWNFLLREGTAQYYKDIVTYLREITKLLMTQEGQFTIQAQVLREIIDVGWNKMKGVISGIVGTDLPALEDKLKDVLTTFLIRLEAFDAENLGKKLRRIFDIAYEGLKIFVDFAEVFILVRFPAWIAAFAVKLQALFLSHPVLTFFGVMAYAAYKLNEFDMALEQSTYMDAIGNWKDGFDEASSSVTKYTESLDKAIKKTTEIRLGKLVGVGKEYGPREEQIAKMKAAQAFISGIEIPEVYVPPTFVPPKPAITDEQKRAHEQFLDFLKKVAIEEAMVGKTKHEKEIAQAQETCDQLIKEKKREFEEKKLLYEDFFGWTVAAQAQRDQKLTTIYYDKLREELKALGEFYNKEEKKRQEEADKKEKYDAQRAQERYAFNEKLDREIAEIGKTEWEKKLAALYEQEAEMVALYGKDSVEYSKWERKKTLTAQQEAHQRLMAEIDVAAKSVGNIEEMLRLMSQYDKRYFKFYQAAAIAKIMIDTAQGIIATYKAMAEYGPAGFVMASVYAATLSALSGAQIGVIMKQKPPEMAKGGVIPATPGGRLVNVAEAGRSEAIVPLDKYIVSQRGQGGGLATYNVVIQALDSRSFADFAERNPGVFRKQVVRAIQENDIGMRRAISEALG